MSSGFNLFGDIILTAVMGLTPGSDVLYRTARRDMVGGAGFVDIWAGPDAKYQGFLPFGVAEELIIKSTSDDDTFGGSGCGVIFVQGLDENYLEKREVYQMNGIAGVTTTGDVWSRVWIIRSVVVEGDVRVPNVGDITVASAFAGNPVVNFMAAGEGRDLSSHFTMPADFQGAALNLSLGTSSNQNAEIRLTGRRVAEGDLFPFGTALRVSTDVGVNNLPIVFTVPPLVDFIIEGQAVTGNTTIFATTTVYMAQTASIGNPPPAPLFGPAN